MTNRDKAWMVLTHIEQAEAQLRKARAAMEDLLGVKANDSAFCGTVSQTSKALHRGANTEITKDSEFRRGARQKKGGKRA